MDIRQIGRTAVIVFAVALLVTFAFAVAPKAPAVGPSAAFAAGTAATNAAPTAAAPTEAKATPSEVTHQPGKLTSEEQQDLNRAWANMGGFNLLIFAILMTIIVVGIVLFGAYKQLRV